MQQRSMDWTRINEAGEESGSEGETGKGGRPEGIEGRIEGRRKGKKGVKREEWKKKNQGNMKGRRM